MGVFEFQASDFSSLFLGFGESLHVFDELIAYRIADVGSEQSQLTVVVFFRDGIPDWDGRECLRVDVPEPGVVFPAFG